MKKLAGFVLIFLTVYNGQAQVDTINNQNGKLQTAALREGNASYVVYFTDSVGSRTSAADIWDRSIRIVNTAGGQKTYRFEWNVYRRDSLVTSVVSTGLFPSMQPLRHDALYPVVHRQTHVQFAGNVVTVPRENQLTAKDSAFHVEMNPPGFAFPMDLELFPLLPFKKVGQQFLMAFYEPGGSASNYYPLTITGKEDLSLPGGQKVQCWLLRIDYRPQSFATFWIADKTHEVLKMQEFFGGRYRYKVRLY